jgi:drug/metabolite transporter (DMT)-like permease
LIWAFSFGLIKTQLADVDPFAVAGLRLTLAALVFAPWLRRPPRWRTGVVYAALGALQFGLMYVLYLAAYRYLPAYGVAVATIFTPLYVVALEDLLTRRWRWRHGVAALLAVAGAAVVQAGPAGLGAGRGFALVQAANLCFAAGQVLYRRLGSTRETAVGGAVDARSLAWMYLGAAAVTAVAAAGLGDRTRWVIEPAAWAVIAYLGVLPTAVGFYLWNRGAVRTNPGILAVCNNLKVPLAVLVAWAVFGEAAAQARVLIGLAVLVAALFVAGRHE